MSDIKFAIFNKHTIPQLAFDPSIDPRQQPLLYLRNSKLIDRFLMTIDALILAGEIIPQLGEAIGEDPFVHPAEHLLILQEQFKQFQLIDCLELLDSRNVREVHESAAVVPHGDLLLHRFDAIQEPLLHLALVGFDTLGLALQGIASFG